MGAPGLDDPGLLGPLKSFRARHARAVETGEDEQAVERLARLVRPFLLRRKKSDPGIVPELPPKTETDHPVPLTREQAALYEAVVRESMLAIETAQGMGRRGLVLKLLTALKQICDHPALYLKEEHAPAGDRLAARSGKLALLDELLDTVLAEDGSALVFTQYVGMARLITRHLAERAVPVDLLHGGTPVPERERMVDRFQSGAVPVLVLSLKAAGTGLNLTRAGHVVHFDRWWNPAVEEQATDRAYRIGQTQPVQVHRLVTEGTVEDRIAEMLQSSGPSPTRSSARASPRSPSCPTVICPTWCPCGGRHDTPAVGGGAGGAARGAGTGAGGETSQDESRGGVRDGSSAGRSPRRSGRPPRRLTPRVRPTRPGRPCTARCGHGGVPLPSRHRSRDPGRSPAPMPPRRWPTSPGRPRTRWPEGRRVTCPRTRTRRSRRTRRTRRIRRSRRPEARLPPRTGQPTKRARIRSRPPPRPGGRRRLRPADGGRHPRHRRRRGAVGPPPR